MKHVGFALTRVGFFLLLGTLVGLSVPACNAVVNLDPPNSADSMADNIPVVTDTVEDLTSDSSYSGSSWVDSDALPHADAQPVAPDVTEDAQKAVD